jgi:hypothetical protein
MSKPVLLTSTLFAGTLLITSAAAGPTVIDAQKTLITINPNHSTTIVSSIKQTLNSPQAARAAQQASIPYFPGFESVSLVKAYRETAQGTITNISLKDVYTHPAQAAKDAPGYTKQLEKTLVYPQLLPGDTIYAEWKTITKKGSPFGFNFFIEPNFQLPTKLLQTIINYPSNLKLYWHGSKIFKIKTSTHAKTNTISITALNQLGHKTEPDMVSPHDLLPYFEISEKPTWESFGNIWNKFYKEKLIITPQVRAKALEVANGSTGIEAIRKFYNWISNYINYIDISPDLKSNYIPHTPQEILTNGYGDCKDYAMLMIAFSKVIGVKVDPAMINWGMQYRRYPLPTSSAIDHAIVYLPKYKLFLNPTNIYATFGTLDAGLRDKYALVLSDHSKLVATPKGSPKKNRFDYSVIIHILPSGSLTAQGKFSMYGSIGTNFRAKAFRSGVKSLLQQVASLTPDIIYINSTSTKNLEQLNQPLVINDTASLPNFMQLNPTSYFDGNFGLDSPTQLFVQNYIIDGPRQYPFVIGAKSLAWNFKVYLPPHYKVVHLPSNFIMTNTLGSFKIRYVNHNTWYQFFASFSINKDIYSADQYGNMKMLLTKPPNLPRRVVVITSTSHY